jgi:hypothetical protein
VHTHVSFQPLLPAIARYSMLYWRGIGALLVRALPRHSRDTAMPFRRYSLAIIANNVWDSPGVDAIDTGFTRIDSQTKTRVFNARAVT